MPTGPSGRMVFEIDPTLKREFRAALARDGRTAKDWLLERIEEYVSERQGTLPLEQVVSRDEAGDTE